MVWDRRNDHGIIKFREWRPRGVGTQRDQEAECGLMAVMMAGNGRRAREKFHYEGVRGALITFHGARRDQGLHDPASGQVPGRCQAEATA